MKVAPNTAKVLRNVPLPDEVAVVHTNAAVLDIGSYTTRLGFAGDTAPRMHQRTAVIPRRDGEVTEQNSTAADGAGELDLSDFCLDKAYSRYLSGRGDTGEGLVPVLRQGRVADWAAWEQLIQRVDDMVLASHAEQNTPLLLTEKALVPISQRQKMAEILYEKHELQATSFALSPVLALYASGLCTGVSAELGHEQSHVVPVFQGFPLFHATHCLDVGGADLTQLLASSTAARLPASTTNPRGVQDVWAYLKEQHGATFESRAAFTQATSASGRADDGYGAEHVLPDGSVLQLGVERLTLAEAYFQPTLVPHLQTAPDQSRVASEVQLRTTDPAQPPPSIPALVHRAITACDEDLATTFYDSIVLSGGSSMFPGLPERLEAEVQALLPPASADRARVTADVERGDAAFVGGSILASLPTFQELWVTRADYNEVGPMAVVRGCL